MCANNKIIAIGACTFITAFLSFNSSNAAGNTLKFAAIGVNKVPQYPAVKARTEHTIGSPP